MKHKGLKGKGPKSTIIDSSSWWSIFYKRWKILEDTKRYAQEDKDNKDKRLGNLTIDQELKRSKNLSRVLGFYMAYLVKSEGSEGFHEIINFLTSSHIYYALIECPTLYISLIEQFWQTAALSTTKDGVHAINATIDGRDKIITEASIIRHLKLQDSEGLTSLPNAEIFEQLTRMGYATTSDSLTF
ncbi:hypothetical protein Tco_0456046 [Tanacetum coccineum]